MKQVKGIWIPDDDKPLEQYIEREGDYQKPHRDLALSFVKQHRTAIDVGAHVGTWTRDLVKQFSRVIAFEPNKATRECFNKNVPAEKVAYFDVALGHEEGHVAFSEESGHPSHRWIDRMGTGGYATMLPLDAFQLREVDYIKIDVDGWEYYVLKGAVETIDAWRPVVSIEQKDTTKSYGVNRYAASSFLSGLGMRLAAKYADDIVFIW